MLIPILLALPALAGAADFADLTSPDDGAAVDAPTTPLETEASTPIINGVAATIDDYPSSGGMLLDVTAQGATYRLLMCSSTLIAPDVVLLAAHCVDEDTLAASFGVRSVTIDEVRFSRQADLSSFDGSRMPEWPTDAVAASEWTHHEQYDYMTMQVGLADNYDLGLLFLSTPILDVPFAYLVTAEEAAQLVVDAPVTVVGWGYQDSAMRGEVGTKQMGDSFVAEVGNSEFQVGFAKEDVRQCHGDSGGPVYMQVTTDSPETLRHVGLTSHTYDTSQCRRTGAVNTRTDTYLTWIDEQMRSRCQAGTRSWCDVEGIIPPPEPPPPVDTSDTAGGDDGGKGGKDDKKCGCATPASSVTGGLALALVGLALARRRRT